MGAPQLLDFLREVRCHKKAASDSEWHEWCFVAEPALLYVLTPSNDIAAGPVANNNQQVEQSHSWIEVDAADGTWHDTCRGEEPN
jgi:hypothetical protein